jgi:hypothetical protein
MTETIFVYSEVINYVKDMKDNRIWSIKVPAHNELIPSMCELLSQSSLVLITSNIKYILLLWQIYK